MTEAEAAVRGKNSGHHIKGYGTAVLDRFSVSRAAIRGREQQLVDFHGGARNEKGYSGNQIRAVSRFNPFKWIYDMLSTILFHEKLDNNNPADK